MDPNAQLIISAFTTPPTDERAELINATVQRLKVGGVWPLLDVLYMFAAADSQAALVNWRKPGTFNATLVNAPTFAADRGFTGNGTTAYIETGYNLLSSGQYTETECHISARNLNAAGTADRFVGNAGGGSPIVFLNAAGGTTVAAQLNGANVSSVAHGGNRAGFIVGVRRGTVSQRILWNGTFSGVGTVTSSAPPNQTLVALRSSTQFNTYQIASLSAGGTLSDEQMTALYAAELAYMQAVGAA